MGTIAKLALALPTVEANELTAGGCDAGRTGDWDWDWDCGELKLGTLHASRLGLLVDELASTRVRELAFVAVF